MAKIKKKTNPEVSFPNTFLGTQGSDLQKWGATYSSPEIKQDIHGVYTYIYVYTGYIQDIHAVLSSSWKAGCLFGC